MLYAAFGSSKKTGGSPHSRDETQLRGVKTAMLKVCKKVVAAKRQRAVAPLISALMLSSMGAHAGGGYFLPFYGGYTSQMAGTATAVGLDGLAASTNPGKLFAVGNRLDLGTNVAALYRRVERQGGPDPSLDFGTTSDNSIFFVPQGGFAHRLGDNYAFGVALYANGALNTAYPGDTGVPSSNQNPAACGSQPANFLSGCGQVGVDLSQVIVAPTAAWQFAPGNTLGISPLIAYQRFRAYGLQAFEPLSQNPGNVSNRGYDNAFGLGVRVGWYGEVLPSLTLGAAYSTKIYMQRFDRYRGLFAGDGHFDVPANYSVGAAFRATERWLLALDVQRIDFHGVPALGNSLLNSLQNPQGAPLGSKDGSGFNWRNQTNYRFGTEFAVSPSVNIRGGLAYGRVPGDQSISSVSINTLSATPKTTASVGFNWWYTPTHEFQFAYTHHFFGTYAGPSAVVPGATESVVADVDVVWIGWAKRF